MQFGKRDKINNRRHWRDDKNWNREEKEKYGIHISSFEKRKEKCWDLFSGSRRERELLQKKWRNSKYFLQFRDEKEKLCKQISWFERRSRRQDFKLFVTRKRNSHTTIPILFFFCPKNEILSPPQRGVLMSNSRIKIVCWRLPLLTEVTI